MRLTWHIVKKDLRRMAWPVAAWGLLMVATMVAFDWVRLPAELHRPALPFNWVAGVERLFWVANAMLGVAGGVLAAFVAQEDSPVDTTAFWPTRPIAGWRLLVAKLAVVGLLLVVAPVLAAAVVWSGEGFSLRETAGAMVELAVWQVLLTWPALALGALTVNLARFILAAIGAGVVLAICALDPAQLWTHQVRSDNEWRSMMLAVLVVTLAGLAGAFLWRYVSRSRGPMLLLAATLSTMVVVAGNWSEDFTDVMPWLRASSIWGSMHGPSKPGARPQQIAWDKFVIRADESVVTVSMSASAAGGTIFAPVRAEVPVADSATGKVATHYLCDRGLRWGEMAALRIAGLAAGDGPLSWEINLGRFHDAVARIRATRAVADRGIVKIAEMRPRVLWEIPLRAGEEARAGASRTRIVEIGWLDGRRTVLLQERDARLALTSGKREWYNERRLGDAFVDCFLVVNRARGFAQAAALEDVGTAVMNSRMISISALRLPAGGVPEQPGAWENGATLIKVRFERLDAFGYEVPGGPVAIVEEQKP